MRMILTEGEVASAVRHYIMSKTGGSDRRDYGVTMHWRSKEAHIDITEKAPPTLTDAIAGPGAT